jgi:hypothetical protein
MREYKYFMLPLLAILACTGVDDEVPADSCQDGDCDHDGWNTTGNGPRDCDDHDESVNPGASEICHNGKDDDCNGVKDDPSLCGEDDCVSPNDCDGDHYAKPGTPGVPNDMVDCDDRNSSIHPGAAEICNNVDDNCDGQIDEGCHGTGGTGGTTGTGGSGNYPGTGGSVSTGGTTSSGGTGGGTVVVDFRFDLPAGVTPPNNVILRGLVEDTGDDWSDFCSLTSAPPNSFWGDGVTYGCSKELPAGHPFRVNVTVETGDPTIQSPSRTRSSWACYELLGADAVASNPPSGLRDADNDGTMDQCWLRSECWRDYGQLRVNGVIVGVTTGYAVANGTEGPTSAGCNFRIAASL